MAVRLLAMLITMLAAAEASAEERCRQFWSSTVQRIELFADYLPTVESRQSLPKEGVFSLQLQPADEVIYLLAPERGRDGGHGGIVTIEGIPAGRYYVALSEPAWIEAVQDDRRLPIFAEAHTSTCANVRQSLEIAVESRPLTLQIGGARTDRVSIGILRIWPAEWRW
jgi:hypothetical protein